MRKKNDRKLIQLYNGKDSKEHRQTTKNKKSKKLAKSLRLHRVYFNRFVSEKTIIKKNGKIETKLNGEQNRKMYILQIEITNEKVLAKWNAILLTAIHNPTAQRSTRIHSFLIYLNRRHYRSFALCFSSRFII